MKYKEIRTANGPLKVSALAIGSTVKMGGLDKESFFELYDMFLDAGGNCIDTARAYGGGQAEALIGEYLRSRGNRDRIVISTKCCNHADDGAPRVTERVMREELETSLKMLGTDHIDIYWLHKDDENTPVESIVDFVNAVIKEGKIGAVGCSNWKHTRIDAANRYAAQTGQRGFEASQIQWNLAEAEQSYFDRFTSLLMTDEAYRWYYENKMPVFAFSSQAQGFFSKAAASGVESLSEMLSVPYVNAGNLKRLERLKEIAAEKKVPVSVPVLAYLINNKVDCVPVFGATRKQMLLEALQAVDFEMTAEEADELFLCGRK